MVEICDGALSRNIDNVLQTLNFVDSLPDQEPRGLASILGDADPSGKHSFLDLTPIQCSGSFKLTFYSY